MISTTILVHKLLTYVIQLLYHHTLDYSLWASLTASVSCLFTEDQHTQQSPPSSPPSLSRRDTITAHQSPRCLWSRPQREACAARAVKNLGPDQADHANHQTTHTPTPHEKKRWNKLKNVEHWKKCKCFGVEKKYLVFRKMWCRCVSVLSVSVSVCDTPEPNLFAGDDGELTDWAGPPLDRETALRYMRG